MGRKSKTYCLLNEFIQRKDDKDIGTLTKNLISNLQINKDPLIKLCGDVIQSLNYHWIGIYEKLYNRNLEEWNEENIEKNKEIDKRLIYQEIAEELSVYMPYYRLYSKLFKSNKNMTIDEIKTEYKSKQEDNSFLWEKRRSDLNLEDIKFLETHNLKKFNRVAAFIILCYRFKNDKDFPIKIDLTNMDNIMDQFDKFIKQFYKSPYSKNQDTQSK